MHATMRIHRKLWPNIIISVPRNRSQLVCITQFVVPKRWTWQSVYPKNWPINKLAKVVRWAIKRPSTRVPMNHDHDHSNKAPSRKVIQWHLKMDSIAFRTPQAAINNERETKTLTAKAIEFHLYLRSHIFCRQTRPKIWSEIQKQMNLIVE